MASKVFLDANVLLDLTLKRADYNAAREIMSLAIQGRIQAFVTPSIIHILGYWLAKAYDQTKAKGIILALMSDLACIEISHEHVINALHSSISDIEDALQYYAALHYRVDYFISRDRKLKKEAISILPIYSPEEFLIEINGG